MFDVKYVTQETLVNYIYIATYMCLIYAHNGIVEKTAWCERGVCSFDINKELIIIILL